MFAQKDFIEASRKFVCVRIETYESKQAETMVRSLLSGAFANTAFCVFDPEGKQRLSRSGRSPKSLAQSRGRRGGFGSDEEIIKEMNRIAARYQARGNIQEAVLEDFNSFRQALNVASADQRLLVFVNADEKKRAKISKNLRKVFADEDVVGKFHLDLLNEDSDKDKAWSKNIKGANSRPSLVIIRAGTFGIDGVVMDQLSLTDSAEEIKAALLAANEKFALLEARKTYSTHVQQGRRNRVYFENEIPYGEDRDADGIIDGRQGNRRDR